MIKKFTRNKAGTKKALGVGEGCENKFMDIIFLEHIVVNIFLAVMIVLFTHICIEKIVTYFFGHRFVIMHYYGCTRKTAIRAHLYKKSGTNVIFFNSEGLEIGEFGLVNNIKKVSYLYIVFY